MSNNGPSLRSFIGCVRSYLLTDAHIRERTTEGRAGGGTVPGSLQENRFYYFDGEARQAFYHGIEDIAMEEARGTLFALVSSFNEFETHRERYGHLAVTVDNVAVAGFGRVPKPIHRVHFKAAPKPVLGDYGMISLEAGKTSILFICRATGEAGGHPFVGFFTFNPRLSQRMRSALTAVLEGKAKDLREFERLMAVDQAAKQIESDFNRQKEAVERAMLGLREDGDPARAGQVATELEKGAMRLSQWKDRLSAMMAQLQGR